MVSPANTSNREIDEQAKAIIVMLQQVFKKHELVVHLHFELEGIFAFKNGQKLTQSHLRLLNQALKSEGIPGKLVTEFWSNQWEYVSSFSGQTPLEEAQYVSKVVTLLPTLAKRIGIAETIIKPVIWGGDVGQMALGSTQIFNTNTRSVHIPNAIQINVSVSDITGKNLVAHSKLGELIQACLIETSYECALLFLPEEDAFERLKLKTKYGLSAELCSPNDISGGHQGSIALYRKVGKHNQPLGCEPILFDHRNTVIAHHDNWQATARIEHRLGASSKQYNVYVNVLFVLLNVHQAILAFIGSNELNVEETTHSKALPKSLFDKDGSIGATRLFEQSKWFSDAIHSITKGKDDDCGERLKSLILSQYQQQRILI